MSTNLVPPLAHMANLTSKTAYRQPLNYKGTSQLLAYITVTSQTKTDTNNLINHNEWLLYHTELEASALFAEYEDLGVNHDKAIARLQIKCKLIKAELIRLKNKLLTIQLRLQNLALWHRETLLGGVA